MTMGVKLFGEAPGF